MGQGGFTITRELSTEKILYQDSKAKSSGLGRVYYHDKQSTKAGPGRQSEIQNVHSRKCSLDFLCTLLTRFPQTKIADLVQINPEDFDKKANQAIEDNLNAKYANRVIQKIGLCVCLYDLLSASEGLIGHGTGLVNVNGGFEFSESQRV